MILLRRIGRAGIRLILLLRSPLVLDDLRWHTRLGWTAVPWAGVVLALGEPCRAVAAFKRRQAPDSLWRML